MHSTSCRAKSQRRQTILPLGTFMVVSINLHWGAMSAFGMPTTVLPYGASYLLPDIVISFLQPTRLII